LNVDLEDFYNVKKMKLIVKRKRVVSINGKQVVKNGQHTGVKSGKFVKGPGWKIE
jgi:N-acyl-D-amino-acid deacylase